MFRINFAPISLSVAQIALCLSALNLAFCSSVQAQELDSSDSVPEESVSGIGDVNIYPRRVTIADRQRTAVVTLFNRTTNDGSYDIDLIDMVMTPQGQLVEVSDADPALAAKLKSARDYIRYSPRRTTLDGNASQVIRLMARSMATLPPGEYRTHFNATSRPRSSDGLTIDDAVGGTRGEGISVNISARFGIAIPVIVRVGETTLDVGLSNASLSTLNGDPVLSFDINRSGTRSAYGDVEVLLNDRTEPVLVSRGIGVYPEIDRRTVFMPLEQVFADHQMKSGDTLTVRYVDDDERIGTTLAQTELQIP